MRYSLCLGGLIGKPQEKIIQVLVQAQSEEIICMWDVYLPVPSEKERRQYVKERHI